LSGFDAKLNNLAISKAKVFDDDMCDYYMVVIKTDFVLVTWLGIEI